MPLRIAADYFIKSPWLFSLISIFNPNQLNCFWLDPTIFAGKFEAFNNSFVSSTRRLIFANTIGPKTK